MSTANAINSLNVASLATTKASQNAMSPDGATQVEVSMVNNGISGPSVRTRRVTNPYQFQNTIVARADKGKSGAVLEYNNKLNSLLGDKDDVNSISSLLKTFTNSFDTPLTNPQSQRSNIVSAAMNFTTQVTGYVSGLETAKAALETDITNSVSSFNNIITQIVEVNHSIGSNGVSIASLQDQRDGLIAQLGEYLAIQYSFDSNGMVTIRTANSNDLVTNSGYAQIAYSQDLNLLSHNAASDVINTMYYDLNGNYKSKADVQVSDVISRFGGRFAGLLDVRDNALPKALSSINNVARQIAFQVDELQNTGSGFPPATSFTSQSTMLTTDLATIKGKVNFAVTDNQGHPIVGLDRNYVKPVDVDFDKLTTRNAALGQFSVQDIINEITQVAAGPSKASVGLGRVSAPAGGPAQWLVDQVRLVPTSDISTGGAMSFQLELNSGSAFDTQFQVTDMQLITQAGAVSYPAFTAPAAITLAAGQNMKTGQNIVANLNAADQFNTIRLKMLVVGANGVCEERFADFVIGNASTARLGDAQIMNQRSEAIVPLAFGAGRIAAVPDVSAPQEPLAAAADIPATLTAARVGSPLISASFVDANGIAVTAPNTPGYLKISASGGTGLIIDTATSKVLSTTATSTSLPANFSHWFELNNFFSADEANPASNIALNPTIAANSNLISLGKAQEKTISTPNNVMVGQTLPSATLDLSAGGLVIANNDTVTIGGTIFTFVAVLPAPGTQNPVLISAGIPGTIQALYAAVKANAGTNTLVTVTQPAAGATQLNIVGTSAAGAVVASGGTIANLWKVSAPGTPGGVVGPVVTQLISGNASAILDLSNGVGPAFAIVLGESVTVNGITFTFGVGGGAQDVPVGGTTAASMANLLTKLNAFQDPRIAGMLTFSLNGTQLTATATHAGSAGNNLAINSVIAAAGGNAWVVPAGVAAGARTTLIGGVDIQSTAQVNTHALSIGVGTNNIFQNLSKMNLSFSLTSSISQQTISSFFNSSFQDVMDNMHEASENKDLVNAGVLEQIQILYDNSTKLTQENREAQYMMFMAFAQYQKMIMNVVMQLFETKNYLLHHASTV